MLIMETTFRKNGGLCMPCKKEAVPCGVCGQRTTGASRSPDGQVLCLWCLAEREKNKPTQIGRWIAERSQGPCSLLRRLFLWDERIRRSKTTGFIGLELIDPPDHYANIGTDLYDPTTTPTNTMAFAHTGGDDVHFSLVEHGGTLGDLSPVVMTVPMAGDDPETLNVVLGGTLHEFLCLGCVHGFTFLEQLSYDRDGTVARLASLENLESDAEDLALLRSFRKEFKLTRWKEIDLRLHALDKQFRGVLQF